MRQESALSSLEASSALPTEEDFRRGVLSYGDARIREMTDHKIAALAMGEVSRVVRSAAED